MLYYQKFNSKRLTMSEEVNVPVEEVVEAPVEVVEAPAEEAAPVEVAPEAA